MESILISGVIGFIGGGILMFFMKDKITSIDQTLHTKIDAIPAQILSAANQLASHVTAQVQSITPKPPTPPNAN